MEHFKRARIGGGDEFPLAQEIDERFFELLAIFPLTSDTFFGDETEEVAILTSGSGR